MAAVDGFFLSLTGENFGLPLIFLKLEDNGATSLTHLLLGGFETDCFLASASAVGCRLVEANCTSRTSKTENF
jgi:hypothetical protein